MMLEAACVESLHYVNITRKWCVCVHETLGDICSVDTLKETWCAELFVDTTPQEGVGHHMDLMILQTDTSGDMHKLRLAK